MTIRPPTSEDELRERAQWLAGRTIGELAAALGLAAPVSGVRGKGKIGDLLEEALGAEAGSAAIPDFPGLGIELKTIPVNAAGQPRESTFVCTISLADAERARWETSVARAKLAHVLFVPLIGDGKNASNERLIGAPLFWKPTPE